MRLITGRAWFVLLAATGLTLAAPAWAGAQATRLTPGAPLFEEPLVPTAQAAAGDDDAALQQTLAAWAARAAPDDTRALEAFLAAHPQSPWRLALLTNLGLTDYRYGYFSKAIAAFSQAWEAGRDATEPHARRLADRALGELLQMHARLGHADELAALLPVAQARGVTSGANEMVDGAKEGLWTMRHNPGVAYLCGPMALKNLLLAQGAKPAAVAFLDAYRSGPHGVTLAQVSRLADQAGLAHRLVHRTPDQSVPVPSIIHWKVNHFAAIVGEAYGRYQVIDPTFGRTLWVTRGAIDAEGSGDFLVAGTVPPAGLQPISAAQAAGIYGMGYTKNNNPNALTPTDVSAQNGSTNQGCPLCGYSFKEMLVSLALQDTPVGYSPPIGPAVRTTITYNQREAGQPANFSFYNVSPQWSLNWLSYITDDPTAPGTNVVRNVGGGGEIPESGYTTSTGSFTPETYDASVLTQTGPATYIRSLPDGSVETYAQSNGATAAPRYIFLSKLTDPQGNAVTLGYDAELRLATITDATGLVTQFAYQNTSFPLQVTQITDPFGRSAVLTYDTDGELVKITDVLGLVSKFGYNNQSLVNSLQTAYGVTQFAFSDNGNTRMLSATDPLGHTETLMYEQNVAAIPQSDPDNLVPPGIVGAANANLNDRDTFYWDKHAYAVAAGDVTQARIRHWAHLASDPNLTSDFLESEKRPLENRVWFNYPGQGTAANAARVSGTLNKPTNIARVLSNGVQQLTQIAYNALGNPTGIIDPVGRSTIINYYPNQIDVQSVQQVTASGPVTIASYGTYDAGHRPSSITDAAGQTTLYTYYATEQLKQVTDPLGEQTQYLYGPQHRLQSIVNADGKTALHLGYDSAGRVSASTDSEGYTLQYGYDSADRTRLVTYPDATTRQLTYTVLDLTAVTDRQNRTTQYGYDAVRNLTSVTDPLGNLTQFNPYEDGVLKQLIDANGNATDFGIDIESRLTTKTYADQSQWIYAYDPATSRLSSVTDPLQQVKTIHYVADDRVATISYTNAQNPTPNVVFAYDPYFPRRSAMTDGDGRTNYLYYPPGQLGALQLSGENPPFANSAIAYTYDALGRLASRSVGGDPEGFGYDAIGRLASHSGDLGRFTLTYLGETGQLASRSNGTVGTAWTYDTNTNDRKLIAVANTPAASAYQFPNNAAEGDIRSIVDSFDSLTWTLVYDKGDRLSGITSVVTGGSTAGPSYSYGPDKVDNLLVINRPTGKLASSPNALNQAKGVNGIPYTYDADGELVQDATRKYAWDAEGRLVGIDYLGIAVWSRNSPMTGWGGGWRSAPRRRG